MGTAVVDEKFEFFAVLFFGLFNKPSHCAPFEIEAMVALEFSDEIAWRENPGAGFVTHRWASLE